MTSLGGGLKGAASHHRIALNLSTTVQPRQSPYALHQYDIYPLKYTSFANAKIRHLPDCTHWGVWYN